MELNLKKKIIIKLNLCTFFKILCVFVLGCVIKIVHMSFIWKLCNFYSNYIIFNPSKISQSSDKFTNISATLKLLQNPPTLPATIKNHCCVY